MQNKYKKVLGLLYSIILCAVFSTGISAIAKTTLVSAATEININDANNFPDINFQKYILNNIDSDKDKVLSEDEINNVKSINVYSKGISNLKGIEKFKNLEYLNCDFNGLESLDISKNEKLQSLSCSSNQLLSLDISKNTGLIYLECNNNKLTSLDVKNNKKLQHLSCSSNQLSALDISQNTGLIYLSCDNNKLEALDVSKNIQLSQLFCDNNKMSSKSLDISNNAYLQHLSCISCDLSSINVGKNSMLTYLACSDNELTSGLDVSNNDMLTRLSCDNCKLTSLSLENNIQLEYLSCNNNNLTELDLSSNTILKQLFFDKNSLTDITLTDNTLLKRLSCNENKLSKLDLTTNELIEVLSCDKNNLSELDTSNHYALQVISCNENQLSELEVKNNPMLVQLFCSNNSISSLNVRENPVLRQLYCDNNQITDIYLRKNTALAQLSCNNNMISALNLEKSIKLQQLSCINNQITDLDLSTNTDLRSIACYDNKLEKLELNVQMYNKLELQTISLHGESCSLSDFSNISENNGILVVDDITKPATYNYLYNNNKTNCTIIYKNILAIPVCQHIFSNSNCTEPVSGSSIVIYGNGAAQKVNGQTVNSKRFITYTDIKASTISKPNNKGVIKTTNGRVIVGITETPEKPVVTKNKIIDREAAKIARASINKKGMVTITAKGNKAGVVYLWVIDTGDNNVSECCPVNVKMAPKRLEVQDAYGNKLKNVKIENGKSLHICVAGIVSKTLKTEDCTYTATVNKGSENYIGVSSIHGSDDQFTIIATGLKKNKNTRAKVTFKCGQNNKKVSFTVTVTPSVQQ